MKNDDDSMGFIQRWAWSSTTDELLQNLEELWLTYLLVPILIDGLDELIHFFLFDFSVATQTLEGVIDKTKDFISLQRAAFVHVIFVENCIPVEKKQKLA